MSGPPAVQRPPAPDWADSDPEAEPPARGRDVTALDIVNVLLYHRWLIIAITVVLAAIGLALGLSTPRTYTATSTFMPHGRRPMGAGTGLAAQLGLSLGQSEGEQSPQFYADLLRSREILLAVVEARYPSPESPDQGRTLVQIYGTGGPTQEYRRRQTAEQLKSAINTPISARTGVIGLEVTTHDPALSAAVAKKLLDELVRFNSERRQSQAVAERQFTQQRLSQAAAELRRAEDRLQAFLQQNREFGGSQRLGMEQDRLTRDVTMRQSIYTSLAQAFEQAKIEEVRDSPVLTVIEAPLAPLLPDPRGALRKAITFFMLGLFLGVVIAFVREYMVRSRRRSTDASREFARLRREALDDLLHPWRPVARAVRSR